MKYEDAKRKCHVRSAIYRTSFPTKIFSEYDLMEIHESLRYLNKHKLGTVVPNVFWKNQSVSLDERIPAEEKIYDDWEEYDPREQPECSEYNEMPA